MNGQDLNEVNINGGVPMTKKGTLTSQRNYWHPIPHLKSGRLGSWREYIPEWVEIPLYNSYARGAGQCYSPSMAHLIMKLYSPHTDFLLLIGYLQLLKV